MINAIKYMDDLIETGFTQEQAKTTVSMWMELMNENLATKDELNQLEVATKNEFSLFRSEMEKEFAAVRSEMKQASADIRSEIKQFENKSNLGFANIQTDLKKMQLILLSSMSGLIAVATTIIGYLIKF